MDVSVLVLALIQGILEWFPVSSSGHIYLFELILGVQSGLDLEVALHFGTLMAVFVYFRKDIVAIVRDLLHSKWKTANSRLGFLIIIASIPAAIFGFIFRSYFEISSTFLVLGFGWIITSTALFIGVYSSTKLNSASSLSRSKALLIGFAQIISLFPGVSRSGMTISSGLLFGLKEKEAVKFSYLLSIPTIIGANLVTFGNRTIPLELLLPSLICFLVGLIFVHISFNFVLNNKRNLIWFAVYTLLLGLTCLYFAILKI
ncbi:undecaprenyl-diphosphate phosphatase [Candidatus Pacearchaeota archaeon]|nr:undecaprenyl-diphosphate phosphatase [Candidatus Pacearchaeota archaeon]